MKLHVLSDLHTEFAAFEPPRTGADVVILAGDIGVGTDGIDWAARVFPDRPVVYVPGNHEYYGHDIARAADLWTDVPDHVRLLDDDACEIDGVRFLGSTLWTDFRFYGEADAPAARRHANVILRDYESISIDARRFTPEDSVELHERCRAWLEGELAREHDGPTVVVTHHLPALPSVAPRYADDALNPAFASRLEPVIEAHRPALWIHGHTHAACDYEIFGTRVVCNPRGYPSEFGAGSFRADLVIEVAR